MLLEPEYIEGLNYPDFVAFIGQKNTPPGGMSTLEHWYKYGDINNDCILLDLACSTGYSSRQYVEKVSCHAYGIDISVAAIQKAQQEKQSRNIGNILNYTVCDAASLCFYQDIFTHVIGGCNFAFIDNKNGALSECHRILKKNGILCVSNFFYQKKPPMEILNKVQQVVGFRPDANWDLQWWNIFFKKKFKLKKRVICELPIFSDGEIYNKVFKTIHNSLTPELLNSEVVKEACIKKLYNTRIILNEHRKYQKFEVSVWSKQE